MAHLSSRQHISPDSGFPVTLHPAYNPKIRNYVPPEPIRQPAAVGKDRAAFADPKKKALFAVATPKDRTESIGTVLEGVQLSSLNGQQLDELALLVNERGVVFFRDQDLTTGKQVELFQHFGKLDKHPAQKDVKHVIIKGSTEDHREILSYTPWPSGDFHADTSFEINPPSYSMLRMEEHPPVGGDTAWTTQLSTCGEAIPNRPPIDTHHPAVRTHPVTGLKALNVNPGFVTGFAELKRKESGTSSVRRFQGHVDKLTSPTDKLLEFLEYHIHSADDHAVRWKWEVGSIAMWDNRCSLHRVIPGTYKGARRGIRTTVFGEKREYPKDFVNNMLTKLQRTSMSIARAVRKGRRDLKAVRS
ncbi:hypothetical protein LTR10_007934 [Elasticomyces elasticus]|nr:hypothetical protein LTR10_007934 [Elasticomyces elasticus]KAK4970933.1 hypothetical protein LTR42_007910 [Elasticomyces elasticus]